MPRLHLKPHVSFAMVDGRAVFLDLRSDRYLALDGVAAKAFDDLRLSADDRTSSMLAEPLLASGLFAIGDQPASVRPTSASVPRRSNRDEPGRPLTGDVLAVLALVVRARCALRVMPIARVLAGHMGRGTGVPAQPPSAVVALASRFRRARALVPIKPTCLQDSLALHAWLAAHGAFATLVLGVRLDPFAAHSWVQHGDTVLNDALDRVATYTPILAIE